MLIKKKFNQFEYRLIFKIILYQNCILKINIFLVLNIEYTYMKLI